MSWIFDLAMWCAACADQANATPAAAGVAAGGAAAAGAAAAVAASAAGNGGDDAGGWMDAGAGGPPLGPDTVVPSHPRPDFFPGADNSKTAGDGTVFYPPRPHSWPVDGTEIPDLPHRAETDLGDNKVIKVYGDGEIRGVDHAKETWTYLPPGAIAPDGSVVKVPTAYLGQADGTIKEFPGAYPVYDPSTGRIIDVHTPPANPGGRPGTLWDPGPIAAPPGTPWDA